MNINIEARIMHLINTSRVVTTRSYKAASFTRFYIFKWKQDSYKKYIISNITIAITLLAALVCDATMHELKVIHEHACVFE